jgi:serine protease
MELKRLDFICLISRSKTASIKTIQMKKTITSIGLSLSLLAGYQAYAHNGHGKNPAAANKAFHIDPSFKEDVNYVSGHIIFKVKEQYRNSCSAAYINEAQLTPVLNYLAVNALAKIYPNQKAPETKYNRLGQAYADLSLTYEITFSNKGILLEKAINLLLATGLFDYTEPRYIRKVFAFTPNDPAAASTAPSTASQYAYLNRINAFDAWDLTLGGTQGDTNVVIAIVDSGTDLAHPDLEANIKINYADPINGIDDDHDGYIDNYHGWDFAGANFSNLVADDNPQIMGSNNVHGSYTSGDAAAVTNNGIGVSGIGFNCKFLPVKCAADNDTRSGGEGYILTGDQGIQYAADHGAKIISCSWGGAGYSTYEQAIITYASINKNCLVVAAAGNDGADEISYPAGYNYVLSVAATGNTTDVIAGFSNWNYTVDLCAPGTNIYNTAYSQSYAGPSGTSMATPITAGGAALVLSKFPSYTGLQAGQRLIATTDNNYSVNTATYKNKLGSGRLDLYAAVTSTVAMQNESIVFTNDSITDHNDLIFTQGDTLFIGGSFINYLAPTSSAATSTITAITGGAYVTALNAAFPLGVMNSNTAKSNVPTPFTFKVGNAPANTSLVFQVTITDGAYIQSYFISLVLNPDYVNITINDVHTTIANAGRFGWSLNNTQGGLGFAYNGDNLLYAGGLMIGTSSTAVSDCIYAANNSGNSDADFAATVTVHKVIPSVVSEFDVSGQYNDASASPVQNLLVRHNEYAWSTPGSLKFVIVEYIIHNTGASPLTNLYAGIFADWDIDAATYNEDKSAYDSFRGMGYSWATPTNGLYAGIRLLTNTAAPNFYAIDNVANGVGGVSIATSSGFSKQDKYTTLSTPRLSAGDTSATGNDICNVMSTGPYTIGAGDSVKVAFALLAGDNLTDLQTSSDTAFVRYNGYLPLGTGINTLNLQNFAVYPNPASNSLNFVFTATQAETASLSLVNTLGQTVRVMQLNIPSNKAHTVSVDVSDLAPGAYMYKVTNASGKSNTGKILISH